MCAGADRFVGRDREGRGRTPPRGGEAGRARENPRLPALPGGGTRGGAPKLRRRRGNGQVRGLLRGGRPLFAEVCAALYGTAPRPLLVSYTYGLGRRDVTVDSMERVF